MKSIFITAAIALVGLMSVSAHAQPYPNRPVRLVVPVAVGGPTDLAARAIAKALQRSLGQSIVVENRTGAGGGIGAEFVAKSAPDGYTWLMTGPGPSTILPHLRKASFDPIKDFAAVSLVVSFPTVITVNKSFPAESLGDVLNIARAGKVVTAAHSGNGGLAHLALALLNHMAKTDLVLVPYTGDAPVINALLGGQVDMGLTTLFAARPHVESGRLKVLANTGGRRSGALPQVPTVAEAANLPGYQGINFIGLLLPTGTPVDIIRKINEHLVAFLKTDEFKNLFPTDDIVASTPAEFEAFLREVNERNARLIQATGIKDSN